MAKLPFVVVQAIVLVTLTIFAYSDSYAQRRGGGYRPPATVNKPPPPTKPGGYPGPNTTGTGSPTTKPPVIRWPSSGSTGASSGGGKSGGGISVNSAQIRSETREKVRAGAGLDAIRAGARAGVSGGSAVSRTPVDRRQLANGMTVLTRPLTPAEIRRGFTGRFASDGRALVKARGRVIAVPASRVGVRPPQTATSQAALATGWSQQTRARIFSDIKSLSSGGGGRGGASGGSGTAKPGITPIFNASAVQGRITAASNARTLDSDKRYSESVVSGVELKKQLASEAQMKEVGIVIAGGPDKPRFRDANRVARVHGGKPEDWVKKSSSSFKGDDGEVQETHWVENLITGKRVEFKTIINAKQ